MWLIVHKYFTQARDKLERKQKEKKLLPETEVYFWRLDCFISFKAGTLR